MEIAFRKNPKTLFAKAICWWTKSPYFHCETIFTNGFTFSADIEVFKTRFKSTYHNPEDWDIINIPISKEDEYKVYDFCLAEDKCLYDIIGILFTQFIPLSFQSPWWWFCSEQCCANVQKVGLLQDIKSHQVDPGKLYKLLKERL